MSDELTQTETGEGGISSSDSAVQQFAVQNDSVPDAADTASVQTDAVVSADTSTEPLEEYPLTYDFDTFESEVNEQLAEVEQDEKAPAYYRNALKQYGKFANQFKTETAPFQEVRSVVPEDDLPTALELVKALHTIQFQNGVPQANVARASEILLEKYGAVVPELIKTLGIQQAPDSQYNYFATALKQQYGIEPEQLEAVKEYLASESVPSIADGYAEAYRALSPNVKKDLPYLSEEAQQEILQAKKDELDRQEQGVKAQQVERQRAQQTIETQAEQTYIERTDSVMDTLINVLSKAQFSSDPKVNMLIAQQNAHMAYNAINPYSAGSNRAKATLKEIGIEIDENRVNNILDVMAESCRLEAYHRHYNNPTEAAKYAAQVARHEQELLAQVNKAAAGLLKMRGQGVTAQAADQEAAIRSTDGRPVIPGASGQGGDNAWLNKLAPVGTEARYRQIADLVPQKSG